MNVHTKIINIGLVETFKVRGHQTYWYFTQLMHDSNGPLGKPDMFLNSHSIGFTRHILIFLVSNFIS
jgi:hypothetical protein